MITATSDGSGGYTYKYDLGSSYSGTPDKASYTLTGACDTTADWSSVKTLNVAAKVTWSAKKHVDNAAPSINNVTYSLASGADLDIPFTLGAGSLGANAITDLAIEYGGTYYSKAGLWDYDSTFGALFTIDNSAGKITISSEWMQNCESGATYELYVVYDGNDSLGLDGQPTATYSKIDISVTD